MRKHTQRVVLSAIHPHLNDADLWRPPAVVNGLTGHSSDPLLDCISYVWDHCREGQVGGVGGEWGGAGRVRGGGQVE